MIEIGLRDKIFVAVVLPLALAALYSQMWRPETVSRLQALESRDRSTVSEVLFPGEKRSLVQAAEAAERELKAEEAKELPVSKFTGSPNDSRAARTQMVVEVFRAAALRVVSSEVAEARGDSRETALLCATGTRTDAVKRKYVLKGAFSAVRAALEGFVERKMPVIVSSVDSVGGLDWRLEVYE
jgi:hypothetical protein